MQSRAIFADIDPLAAEQRLNAPRHFSLTCEIEQQVACGIGPALLRQIKGQPRCLPGKRRASRLIDKEFTQVSRTHLQGVLLQLPPGSRLLDWHLVQFMVHHDSPWRPCSRPTAGVEYRPVPYYRHIHE